MGKAIVKSCEQDDKKDTAIRQHNQLAKEYVHTASNSKAETLKNQMGRLRAKHNLSDADVMRGTTEVEAKIANGAKAVGNAIKNGVSTAKKLVDNYKQNKQNQQSQPKSNNQPIGLAGLKKQTT